MTPSDPGPGPAPDDRTAPAGRPAAGEPTSGPVPGAAASGRAPRRLTARDRAVLALERRSWPGPGAKERAVREELGLSPVRYYQLLNALLNDPAALEHDPVTVNRLRRLRASREDRR
ncbi:DUF3263 domain-containing protein [Streptomyces sp. LP05-1]|uniref:DUF3263 domain-containing protein n=1 Tax=Streptomyces pyxinae TaxID=2970734 RepID=A0ABT2CHA9_9ACTN|nr:DUF3263 domain-containing protein [Streptomyces sp. LP05-1]MCS0636004.1 DUF3263 domain-containing protein [Streptomyces sp. LP05-1]